MKRASTVSIDGSRDVESASSEDEGNETDATIFADEQQTRNVSQLTKANAKKKKYEQRFQNSWLSESQFKDWLEKRDGVPYCKLCHCKLSCAKTALRRHTENKKHKDVSRMKQRSIAPVSKLLGSRDKAAEMEIKLCSFVVEKNLSISIVEDLLPLLRDLFPSDETLHQVALGKQKATNVIRQVLGFHSIQLCVSKLRANKFSLIIDETTDRSTTSQLAVLGVYFDESNFKLETILIDLVPLPNGTAATIYETLMSSFKEKDIPMTNVIGFCADSCNVMFGANHSVAQMLTRDYPWIVAIKCSSHLIHLCSSYASMKLPKSVEDLCRNISSHFSLSSKRVEAFKEFQEFLDLQKLKILKPGHTRWLSMKLCVKRILEQYAALKLYFTNVVFEDPTHTNDSILASLNNKFNEAYLEFMDYNLGRMVSFNVLFQSEMPLLHKLKEEVEKLIKSICFDFMELVYVRNTDAFKIDPSRSDKQVPLTNVYLGVAAAHTLQAIREECGSGDPGIPLIYTQCRDFLIEAVKQIQERFSDCKKLDVLSCLSPQVAYNLQTPSLSELYVSMPFLADVADLQSVDEEWRGHSLNPDLNENLSPEEYWRVLFREKTSLGEQAKPNLVKVVKTLLSLPYSNAAVERVFSQLKLIKTDHRCNLKHESLLALLMSKMTLLKSSSAEESSRETLRLDTKVMLGLHHAMKANADDEDVTKLRKGFIAKLKTD